LRIIPNKSKGFIRDSKGKVDPVETGEIDILWSQGIRSPVRIISHNKRFVDNI
jgi:hypothetical protein